MQTADWIFAADVITNEQYAEVIRKIFVERLDLDPSAFNHTIYDFLDDEEYYRLRHGVTEEKLSALYVGIRRSWYIYDSETRKLALSLAQARAGAGVTLFKAEAEDAADDEPTPTVEESEEEEESLGNIHSCINGGKVSLRCLISYISFVRILLLLPLLTVRLPFTCSVVDASCCTCTSWVRRMIGC